MASERTAREEERKVGEVDWLERRQTPTTRIFIDPRKIVVFPLPVLYEVGTGEGSP